MKNMIRWVNTNPGAPRDEQGFWRSAEGRFEITPQYRHTVNPDGFQVMDLLVAAQRALGRTDKSSGATFDRVRDAKAWAARRCQDEMKREVGA